MSHCARPQRHHVLFDALRLSSMAHLTEVSTL